MHKIKKRTAQVTLKQTPENAEFNQLHSALENLAQYLKGSSKALNDCENSWSNVCNKQLQFAETFASRYPDNDVLREMGKQSAQASHTLIKTFTRRSEASDAPHWKIDAIVHTYLDEISSLSSEYKKITPAYTEVARYSKKVSDLQQAKKPSDEKVGRNLEKLEDAKRKYEDIMERLINQMKEVYGKRQIALKANYVAYWSSQLRAFDLVGASLATTREFVNNGEAELRALDIRKMTPENVAKFVAENAKFQIASPRAAGAVSQVPAAEPGAQEGTLAPGELPTSPIEGSKTGNESFAKPGLPSTPNNSGFPKDVPMSPMEQFSAHRDTAAETAI